MNTSSGPGHSDDLAFGGMKIQAPHLAPVEKSINITLEKLTIRQVVYYFVTF
jgi:hypothetical protein